ncbi:galactose-1-phosphate uridylyltransferase [Anaerocolumna cellulosilytica]|uniref:Galactose-1-phosphate uridylyltransferase n=1 Tax=Anaerocolumna cellulosilytica TaxID=433286 RepID=A0A6S6R0A3_9FIRM|nr:UDP-glucose--hexose-1-phosphate uridylyltransferase [Anaerocolumna cellulosilytica]MBB5194047.1 UDPglucose--hexose-1-phosphate uridylyltransferase [Anaerocolumna cellulosilytica]BCJ94739.1 galactose-1-phosphate uridylyltransferase [Anaerocolumna cellulosilytica]
MINQYITALIEYGLKTGLITQYDEVYTVNRILEVLQLEDYEKTKVQEELSDNLEEILKGILDFAVEKGLLEDSIVYRDLFDTKLMGLLVPRPTEIITQFDAYFNDNPQKATAYYYKLSQDSDYIRRYRIAKDKKWITSTEYGDLDITINLSKPEKDPKAIAAAKLKKQTGYPKCLLCKENEGFYGNVNHPARQNHRIIPVKIQNQNWGLQYSPYVYYNEHCIVFHSEHTPMKINKDTFIKLFDFVKLFPHYFVGSNADLPIVGGSILTHDHFQGGNYEFAMAKAPIEKAQTVKGFEGVKVGIVKWPMSVIRLQAEDTNSLIELGSHILTSWRNYTDEEAFVYAFSDKEGRLLKADEVKALAFDTLTNYEAHNTITPIARKAGKFYELDLVLRNNVTTKEHPFGVYHPHEELHHIKKENIGLIEVMGLAVLPSRLKEEMELLREALLCKKDISFDERIGKHKLWVETLLLKYTQITEDTIDTILQEEVGIVFSKVLEHAGVYKRDENGQKAFCKFLSSL